MDGLGVTNSKVLGSCHRLDRLEPNLVHVCGLICKWNEGIKTIRPTIAQGGSLVDLWGQQFKSLGNEVKRLDRLGLNFAHIM